MSAEDDLETRWQAVEATYPVEAWVDLDDQRQLDLLFGPGVRRPALVVAVPDWADQAIADYLAAEGALTVNEAAARYGRSAITLLDHMRRRGVRRFHKECPRRHLTAEERADIVRRWQRGVFASLPEAARAFDLHPTTIRNVLRRAGL